MPAQVQYAAPEFHASDLSPISASLTWYAGRIVFVSFWATWCPPCRKEMLALQPFHDDYAARDLAIVAISQGESSQQALEFVRRYTLTFPICLDPASEAERLLGTNSLPSTLVLDRQGMARLVRTGEVTEGGLEEDLGPLSRTTDHPNSMT